MQVNFSRLLILRMTSELSISLRRAWPLFQVVSVAIHLLACLVKCAFPILYTVNSAFLAYVGLILSGCNDVGSRVCMLSAEHTFNFVRAW